ncbi:oxidoreductase [Domibacillus indicus]|uniref:oxidoreductase n=1 Tax=Domibacillus indicus TaxID=1437523 RepID=UPI000617F093|nr:oxidoreductase [Domibacillus indicus]
MKLTIGFIGFGKSTTRYHLPYVFIRDHLTVKTIFNRKRKPELEKNYTEAAIQFTDELDEILSDPDIQLVSICTPPDTHYSYAKQCLEHGKHVLVEKPFCSLREEAEELLMLAKEKNLAIMPFQNRRFDGDFLAVKEVIEKGYLGEIVEIESHFDYFRPEADPAPGAYYNGAFYGLGVHTLDQIISLFGRPRYVAYDIRSVRRKENPDDTFEAQLFYENMKAIVKTSHLVKMDYPKFIVHGKKGSFIKYGIDQQEACLKAGIMPEVEGFGQDLERAYGQAVYIDSNGEEQKKTIPTPQGDYGKVYDNLHAVILGDEEKLVSDEELLTNMEILERGFEKAGPHVVELEKQS